MTNNEIEALEPDTGNPGKSAGTGGREGMDGKVERPSSNSGRGAGTIKQIGGQGSVLKRRMESLV